MGYFSQNRHKFYLKCHTIFVCKYRKQLINENVRVFILSTFKQIEEKSDFEIEIMETDKDHIHLLINYPPTVSVSSIARRLKQISTIELWKQFPNIQISCLNNFGKSILFGQTVTLFVPLVKQTQTLLENILKIKVRAIHPTH